MNTSPESLTIRRKLGRAGVAPAVGRARDPHHPRKITDKDEGVTT